MNRPVPLDAINELNQVRDELLVVWLALQSDQAEEHTAEIGEHINGLHCRVCDILKKMGEGRAVAMPVRMVGGERNG